jgi:hypothetical protein
MGAFSASAYAAFVRFLPAGFCSPVSAFRFLLAGFCLLVSACWFLLFLFCAFCAFLWLSVSVPLCG